MTGHLLLLDASGYAHRAFHATNATYRESDGMPTWAVIGFMALTFNMLGRAAADQPTHAAAVFDHPSKTFRHKLFKEYKAKRNRSEELTVQLPFMREAARVLGMASVEQEGFEADDVIATLATRAAALGIRTTIVSSDKDMCQLVKDGVIEIVDPMAKKRIGEAEVKKKFGVPPHLVTHVQALCGDSVDNIPGVPGVGKEIAAGLIRAHGDLDKLLAHVKKGRGFIGRVALSHAMRKAQKDIPLYFKLVTLKTDVPLDATMESLEVNPIFSRDVNALLTKLEATPVQRAIFAPERKTEFRIVPGLLHPRGAFDWHTKALKKNAGRGVIPEIPQCGWYKRKLVHGGPWVAGRIWREPDIDLMTGKPSGKDVLYCEVGGQRRDVYSEWMKLCTQPIKEEEFNFLIADAKWAKENAPNDPAAKPTEKIDWNKAPLR